MVKKPGFFVLLMAAMWLASASSCETLNGDPYKGAVDLDVGRTAACAIDDETSEIECWGRLHYFGYGSFATPVDPGVKYEAVAVGTSHACGVKQQPATGVRCWGSNDSGRLGDGTTSDSDTPVDVVGLPDKKIVDLSAGGQSTCATFDTGVAYCWGRNSAGQLGDGSTVSTSEKTPPHPLPVLGPDQATLTGVMQTTVANLFACALRAGNTVLCWGNNDNGRLGVGPLPGGADKAIVAQQLSVAHVESISSNDRGACAMTSFDLLYCWGNPIPVDSVMPQSDFPSVYSGFSEAPLAVSMGTSRICAVLPGGTAECVGSMLSGALGDGSDDPYLSVTPVTVSGSDAIGFEEIHTNADFSCARTLDPERFIRCWGRGDIGQIGNGDILDSPTPVQVVRPFN